MNKTDNLKVISQISSVIGILELKWERPHSDVENAVMRTMLDTRETVRKNHEAEQEHAAAMEAQNKDIFSRMTPDLVASVLKSIATRVAGENPEDKPHEIDITHLRQIADWLEAQGVMQ